jgi:hypothetical protein
METKFDFFSDITRAEAAELTRARSRSCTAGAPLRQTRISLSRTVHERHPTSRSISRRRGCSGHWILVGGLTLFAFRRYRPLLERWVLSDPSQLAQRLTTVVVFLVVEGVTRRLQNRKLPDTLASHAFDEHELGIQPSRNPAHGRSVASLRHSATLSQLQLPTEESTEMGLLTNGAKTIHRIGRRPMSADRALPPC